MDKNFDNKFSQKVKEVFENNQEPYNPEDWEKLKSKKDEDKNHFLFWFFGKYAAVILLFVIIGGTGGLVLYNTLQNITTPFDTERERIIGNTDSNEKLNENDSIYNLGENDFEKIINESKRTITDGKNDVLNNNKSDDSIRENLYSNGFKKSTEEEKVNKKNIIVSNQQKNNIQNKKLLTEHTSSSKIEKDSNNGSTNKSRIIAFNLDQSENLNNSQVADTAYINQNILVDYSNKFANSDSLSKKDINPELEKMNVNKIKNNKITLGLAVSTIINYDQVNQNTNISIGGGVLLEIPIFKNFDIYTGLLVINQRINFQENVLQEIASGSQLKSKEVVLTGLDIPMNLKYNFTLNNSKMFIAMGLSSVTYLKENIESTFQVSSTVLLESVDNFNNPILLSSTVNTFEKETEKLGPFNNFNFGKIINLSFGVELPLKNNLQSLIIEPYFKYSLEPLTSENINFSSVGIILKINFNGKNRPN